jgi:RimJ/RimL family protein N-acetyltransferase
MIETERLLLRDWREEDLDPFVRHTNTPAVMRWLGGVQDPEALKARWRERVFDRQEALGFTFWAVERKEDGALLGFCGLKISNEPNSPVNGEYEAAWRFREDSWGQGYAREAAFATLDFALGRLAAPRVVALTVPGNRRSRGLMERHGMHRRADLDFEGAPWAEGKTIVYEICREDET